MITGSMIRGLFNISEELKCIREAEEIRFEWLKSHCGLATKQDLKEMEQRIMATQTELIEQVKDLKTKIGKIGKETDSIKASIEDLKTKLQAALDAANNSEASPELVSAIKEAVDALTIVDEKVDDLPVPETPA